MQQSTEFTRQGVRIARRIPLVAARKAIAQNMVKSASEAPSVTILEEWRVEELVKTRERLRQQGGSAPAGHSRQSHITYTHLLVRAIALALRRHPLMNSTIADGEILVLDEINVGIAVALDDGGLTVPVIHAADTKGAEQIAAEAGALVKKARSGTLQLKDVRGGTFTLTNTGVVSESRWQTPIVTPGQCGILAIGAVRQAPVVEADRLVVGQVLDASLTFDHRIVNGLPATEFMRSVASVCNSATIA